VAVIGPSGSGKSTLLNLLGLLDRADAGTYRLTGRDTTGLTPDEAAALRSRQIGFVFQSFHLVPRLTAAENIALPMLLAGIDAAERKRRVQKALAGFGLADRADHRPNQLSGGQRQRVAIARTLALQPDLLLMDEPFSSLDAVTRQDLRELTLDLWREQGFTFVVVTHAIEEAAHLGQSILVFGSPPHRQPEIIANPCFGRSGLDEDPEYRTLLRLLRARLAEETAARPEAL
jgi:putative ABC transport system ATP-binding protein